jgi:polar amino acid transport system permease protein
MMDKSLTNPNLIVAPPSSRAVFRFLSVVGIMAAVLAAVLLLSVALTSSANVVSIVSTIWKWTPLLFMGFLFNLVVSVLAMAIGTIAGVMLGIGQVSPSGLIRRVSWFVTQFFRNAPWLVLLFYCILLLPFEIRIAGVTVPLPGWIKATIGLALPVMGNVSEIVRGGIQSIPSAQWESAEALAFTRRQTMWGIILPQSFKRMLPPWMNVYAVLTMATPLMSVVGVEDVMAVARSVLAAEGRTELLMPVYMLLLSWFFIYCYPIARWTVALESRFNVKG